MPEGNVREAALHRVQREESLGNHKRMQHPGSRAWLIILLIGAFALRMGFCAAKTGIGRALERDYLEYVLAGQRLVQHGTLVSPLILADTDTTPSSLLPPAYAALVAGVYALFGTGTFVATLTLQVINALATSLAVLGVFFITRRLAGDRAAWVAALVATVNPTLFGYTHLIWDTSLFTLGVVVTVWLSLRLSSRGTRWRNWFGFGLWLGALAMLNPALTVAYPFLVLWPLSNSCGWRLRPIVRGLAVTVLGWLVVITPWTLRNYHHFGELMYIRGGLALELWLGVCPEADMDGSAVYTRQFPLKNDTAQRRVASIGERAYIEECRARAMKAVSADPGRLVRLIAVRLVDYWGGTVYSHSPPGAGGWPRSLSRAGVTFFMLAEVILVAAFLLTRPRAGRDVPWLLATVISFSLVYCLTHVQIRFRAPTEPIMAILLAMLSNERFRKST